MRTFAQRKQERIAYQDVYFAKRKAELAERMERRAKNEALWEAARLARKAAAPDPKKRHVPSDPTERALYLPFIRQFVSIGVSLAFLVALAQLALTNNQYVRLFDALCVITAFLELWLIRELRIKLKYRRMYRYEKSRRISVDQSFLTLRRQFDAEISELNDLVSSSLVKQEWSESEDLDSMTPEQIFFYAKGMAHGKVVLDAQRAAEAASGPEEPKLPRRSGGHLKLVRSSTDEVS